MHRFNDLPWNPGHRDIQESLQGLLRERGRPVQKAAALTLAMLRQLVATCDASARGTPHDTGLRGRSGWTTTFVASLELAKQGEVALEQEDSFASISVHAGRADKGCLDEALP